MVIDFSSMGFAFHPSNLTASGSQSFAESSGDSKGHSPWRAFGDFPRDGKVTRGGGAERPPSGDRSQVCRLAPGAQPPLGECRRAAPLVHPSQRAGATAGATAPERKKKG